MTETVCLNQEALTSLVELGTKGLFPIFHPSWIEEASLNRRTKMTPQELARISQIEKSLSKHKSLERKKTVMMALRRPERQLFITHFLQLVEGKILKSGPTVH